jgi:hypothetical protein
MLNPADAGVFQAHAPDRLVYSVDLGNQGALDVCDLGATTGSWKAASGRRGNGIHFG